MDSLNDAAEAAGFPISEIPGSKPAHGSPGLIAACHVLHLLLAPRHPPNALFTLEFHPCAEATPHTWTCPRRDTTKLSQRSDPRPHLADRNWIIHIVKQRPRMLARRSMYPGYRGGGAGRDRTDDLLLAKQALSHLSYGPVRVVGLGRLELPTSRLSGVRSNRLSYRPIGARPAQACTGHSGRKEMRRRRRAAICFGSVDAAHGEKAPCRQRPYP